MTISRRKVLANGTVLVLNREQGVTVQASKENSLDPWKLIPRDVWDSLPDAPEEPVPDYSKIKTKSSDIHCWMGNGPIRPLSVRVGSSEHPVARMNIYQASSFIKDLIIKRDWMSRNAR